MAQRVQLYQYDLTNGLAAKFGPALLGRPIEAIWHTSIVVYGTEHYFDSAGIERDIPGKTRFGTPVKVTDLGETQIPPALFESYLDGLSATFGPGMYHLLERNCNNFSNEASEFLVGRGIPSDIVSMPQDLLNSPIGQMLRPSLENAYGPGAFGHAGAPARASAPLPAPPRPVQVVARAVAPGFEGGRVHEVTSVGQVGATISSGAALVIDFTSENCAPCRVIAPVFAQLAGTCPAVLCFSVRTDLQPAIAGHYGIRVTPTFLFFHNGKQLGEMKGANREELQNRVFDLDRLAKASAPAPVATGHVHTHLAVPLLRTTTPAAFESSAKLPVVMAKIATLAAEARITAWTPAHARSVEDRLTAILAWTSGAAAAPPAGPVAPVANLIEALTNALPIEARFPALDLWRLLLLDPAAVVHYANVNPDVLPAWLDRGFDKAAAAPAPPLVRTMLLRASCNCFRTEAGRTYIANSARPAAVRAAVQGLLASDALLRETAAALAYNLSLVLPKDDSDAVVEVTSAVVHQLQTETVPATVHKLLAALGRLAYCNDGAGALAATLGIGAVLARLLSTATAADRDLILQLQLVLPTD